MTSVVSFVTCNPGRPARNSSVKPKVTAKGTICHSLMDLGSMSSQCSRRPTEMNAGILGTAKFARPVLAAHQLADTAMAKASTAVYSAFSLDGYTL